MTMFDNYLAVDWSANNSPVMGENSIWLSLIAKDEFIDLEFPNPSTRHLAYNSIGNILHKMQGRTLVGFDFTFGYPANSYNGFGCDNWVELWDLISKKIDDKTNNQSNRFKVASDFNQSFYNSGKGNPFWGRPEYHKYDNLKQDPPEGYDINLPSEFRITEQELKKEPRQPPVYPKSVWQLFKKGAVGSQALVGIPVVNKLRKELNCSVWPFEKISNNKKNVIAEIYPAIWKTTETGQTKDEKQVKTVAKKLACLDNNGKLESLLQAPHRHPRKNDIIKKEGWILGVDETGNPAQCP